MSIEEFRKVYGTPEGKKAFIEMLRNMKAFCPIKESEIGIRNEGIRFLESAGIMNSRVICKIVDYIFSADIDRLIEEERKESSRNIEDYMNGTKMPF